jgi:hypothetical protein
LDENIPSLGSFLATDPRIKQDKVYIDNTKALGPVAAFTYMEKMILSICALEIMSVLCSSAFVVVLK